MQTVIQEPTTTPSDFVLYYASVAEDIPPWGTYPALRDMKLREFWPTEYNLAGAVFSTAAKYAAYGCTLTGDPDLVEIAKNILTSGSEFGEGWTSLWMKTLVDLFTQDNGAFIEVVRTKDDPTAPVIQLNHLDAQRCIRTGRRDVPVIYKDIKGRLHELKRHEVLLFSEMPSPIETMYGMQYCAVTRLLRAAEIMKAISIYNKEKISGRFVRAVHLVGGIQTRTIEDATAKQRAEADASGLIRYIQPLIIGSLDPTAHVSVATIELASLPSGFDEEKAMRWYVNQLALAFGQDYQDFAPLPGGGLGTSEQSKMLNIKSRGKGPRLFRQQINYVMNNMGILPPGVKFSYGDQDITEDMDTSRLRRNRAEERRTRIESGEITPAVAQQIAVDCGDLDKKYLSMLGQTDITEVVSESTI